MRNTYKILVGKPQEKRDYFGDLGVDGKIVLDWILKKQLSGYGPDSSGSGRGPVTCSYERGNKSLVP
jgi:hypothetical protein